MPDLKNPTVKELRAFFTALDRQIMAAGTTPASTTGSANEKAARTALVEAAFATAADGSVYHNANGRMTAVAALKGYDVWAEISVDDMRTIVADAFYAGAKTRTFALASLATGVNGFDSAYTSCDTRGGAVDPTTGVRPTVMQNFLLTNTIVRAVEGMTTNATNARIVVRDRAGAAVDDNYGAEAFCKLVSDSLDPFVNNTNPLATERTRQIRVSENQFIAFQRIVRAAAEADTTTPAGQDVVVAPVAFMQDRFDPTNTDQTRSDFLRGVDPSHPND